MTKWIDLSVENTDTEAREIELINVTQHKRLTFQIDPTDGLIRKRFHFPNEFEESDWYRFRLEGTTEPKQLSLVSACYLDIFDGRVQSIHEYHLIWKQIHSKEL